MRREWTVVRALVPLLRRHAAAIGALVVLGVVVALSEGLGLGLFMPLVGSASGMAGLDEPGGRLHAILAAPFASLAPADRGRAVLLCLLAVLAVRNLTVLAHGALQARLTSRLAHELRSAAVGRVLHAEERCFDGRDTGTWLNLLESQTWETAAAVGGLVGIGTRLCKIGVFAVALLWISWPLTLLVAVALGLVSVVVRLAARGVAALGVAEKDAWEVLAQRLVETLRTRRTIRAFGREAFEQARFDACSNVERRTFRRLQVLQTLVPSASELLAAVVMLAALWTVLETPGQLAAGLTFLALLYRLHPQIQQLDAARVALAAAAAPALAVMELLGPAATPVARPDGRPFVRLAIGIAFRGVTLRYEASGPPALDAVTLRLPAGATTVVAGPSGAGKSTLVRLLLRLLDPSEGAIEVDGVPLPSLDVASWRARIAVVGQDVPLLDASVADNIAYGRPTPASATEIRQAARRADAEAFIAALPFGYATRVGADGVRLSAGQRQRLALARALLREPEILVLDEATNAVDDVSAERIRRTLAELAPGRTLVVVSHRLSTLEAADHVVLLEGGRVGAEGAPRDVLGSRPGSHDRPRAHGEAGR